MGKNKAFTLIEILVVTTIILLFSGVVLTRYNNYTQELKLKNEAKKMLDVVELTKKKALSAELFDSNCTSFTGYRVTISPTTYSMLFGCASVSSTVQNYNLTTNITVTTGNGDYDFPPLMINPIFISNTIRFKNSVISKCVDISVSALGIFELDDTLIGC